MTPDPISSDAWNLGDPYERYVGRWSRLVARDFLDWLDMPPGLRWLDLGCGTGALTAAIVERAAPAGVVGVEPSAGFLAKAQERLQGKAVFHPGDAFDIPVEDASIDVLASGLVLNFVPDTARGLAQMSRKTKPGGTVAAYVWDYAQGMELMRHFWDAAVKLDPPAQALDEGLRFPLCRPEALEQAFRQAGLREVEGRALEVPIYFRSFEDYWTPFLGGQGPAPSYVSGLDELSRSRLRDELRRRLPTAADGSIALVARAWAVRGQVAA